MALEDTAGTLGHDEAERLHQSADLVQHLDDRVAQLAAPRDQRPRQHAVEALHSHDTVEPDLGQMRQTVGVVRIGLVGRHVERCLGVPRIDADRWQPFRAERMVEPNRQRPGLEHHPLDRRRVLADQLRQELGIRRALAAPHPLTVPPDRNRRVLQRG